MVAVLNDLAKEAEPRQDRQATRRRVLALASVGVLIVDVLGLLALAVIVPFLRSNCEESLSSFGTFTTRGVSAVIEFLVSINGIDYALFFVVLALILIVKEIPIRDKKATLAVNLTVAVGGMVFAFLFTIAMHVPLTMLLWDTRKVPSGTEAKPNGTDAKLTPFWPASQKEHRITKRRIVGSKYTTLDGRRLLRFETELVVATFDIQDVIEYFGAYIHFECDKALAERLRKENDIRSQYWYDEFPTAERERLRFCIAFLLEQGKFIITLRSNGHIVPEIIACEWSNVRGPLDGIGGQAFYLKDGRVFFWTVDWIS